MQKRRLRIFPDTNLFIASAKSGITKSTALIFKLCFSEEIELVGNSVLLEEYRRYKEYLGRSGSILLEVIEEKIRLVEPDIHSVEICKKFMPKNEFADIYHASTCLKADAILITNDKHFDEIKKRRVIQIWSIKEAIENLL
ncbi:MAG: PIN domain-containing protein [Archaeoglobi archaeon]|uniref:PIN domain-containing protein n=1 Tax=Geoglobus ahangari TaxID=113653 RepID=UPI0009FEFCCA|nr:PIN domain-containing protein [Geoglobus ahangari]NOY11353.1 PIN domain-containing protein [Archaeoglobi archaeon]